LQEIKPFPKYKYIEKLSQETQQKIRKTDDSTKKKEEQKNYL
jgi:hypothetical protein